MIEYNKETKSHLKQNKKQHFFLITCNVIHIIIIIIVIVKCAMW